MDRYLDILKRAIAASGARDRQSRLAVYVRVRAELDRLVKSSERSFTVSEQIAQQTALEQAIARIEAAYAEAETNAGKAASGSGGDRGGDRGGDQAGRRRRNPFAAFRNRSANRNRDAGQQGDRQPAALPPQAHQAQAHQAQSGQSKPAPVRPPDTDPWDDDADRAGAKRRTTRLAIVFGVAIITVTALGAGLWILLSSLTAPSAPAFGKIANRLESRGSATLFSGAEPDRFKTKARNTVSGRGSAFHQGSVHVSSTRKTASDTDPTEAAWLPLTARIGELLTDKTLRVTVVARAAADDPSPEMALAIVDGDSGTTGWRRFAVDRTFRPYTVEYAFPPLPGSRPIIAVWADTDGAGRGIEINEVSLLVAPN